MSPTPIQGGRTEVYLNGWDVGYYLRDVASSLMREMMDHTTFKSRDANGNPVKEYLPGQADATAQASGFYDSTLVAGPLEDGADKQFDLAMAAGKDTTVLTVCPTGEVMGARAWNLQGNLTKHDTKAGPAGLVDAAVEVQSSVARDAAVILAPLAVYTNAGNHTSFDYGAAVPTAANGGSITIHNVDWTSGNLAVLVGHSTDNITFVTLASFTNPLTVDAQYERVAYSGTTNRYVRVQRTGTGVSKFHVNHMRRV